MHQNTKTIQIKAIKILRIQLNIIIHQTLKILLNLKLFQNQVLQMKQTPLLQIHQIQISISPSNKIILRLNQIHHNRKNHNHKKIKLSLMKMLIKTLHSPIPLK